MKLSERVRRLEERWYTDKESQPEAVIISMVSARLDADEPLPITRFSFSGHEIHREDGESYPDFEARATDEARKHLTLKHAVPVLLANGSIENS